jgi:predicted extracellular nuclease
VSTSKKPRAAVLGVVVGALTTGGLAVAVPASAASPDVVINEVYGGGGNAGATYTNDFIELQNNSSRPVSVTGWSVQYASSGGSTWTNSTTLTGTIAPGGRYLVQEAAQGGGTTPLPSPNSTGSIAMSGTAGKVALVSNSTPLTCGADCDTATGVRDFVGYGTAANDYETAPTATLSNTQSATRTAGDTDNNSLDFTRGAPTPNSSGVTADPVPTNCPSGETIAVGTVQGSGATSPCVGETVTVAGTVVGDLQDGGFGGFFVQDAGDGDTATSDGLFVYDPNGVSVVPGDQVTVTGTVAEFSGVTQIGRATITVGGPGTLPAATTLPLPSTDAQREALEGMLVAPTADLTVTEVYNLNRYGEIMLAAGGRLITPTETAEPGTAAKTAAAANAARSLLLDDGRTTNLSTAGEAPPHLTLDDPVRVGDTALLEPVVLSYGFNAWRLQPADGTAAGTTFPATNPRPTTPDAVGGNLRIADFNVLNYFVDFPSEFGDDARGATNAEELAQQQAKIVTAITALDADVITLHEIENSAILTPETPYRALETLVAALNAAEAEQDGIDTWRFVRAHEASDVITNAIIYRINAAQPVGQPMKPAEDSVWDNAREPIAQTFRSRGEVFTVIANHLKSKGSGSGINADQGDGQGASNPDRVAQAQSLVAFAAQVAAKARDEDVLLTGDFNAYRTEDPLDVIRQAGFTEVFTPGEYSYVFDGGSGSLDHVFASPSMLPKVTGHTVWDINSVESYAYEYDGFEGLFAPYAYRASDHNPTLLGVDTKTGTPAAGTGR